MPTTSINKLPKDLERNEESTEDSGNVLGPRSGNWATAPADCLTLIFETGLECIFPESEFTKERTNDEELCQFISAVSQTCRWWRQVALELPRLWSTLIVGDTTPLEMLETWLARSKVAPLSINLKSDFPSWTSTATSLLPLLLEHIHRWGRLRYLSNAPWVLENFLEAVEGEDAPLLQGLYFRQEANILDSRSAEVAKIFNGPDSLPKLSNVDICGVWLDWGSSRPFRNLRSLSLARIEGGRYVEIEQFKNLLLESQQLNRLRLVRDVVRVDELVLAMWLNQDDQAPQPISLPSLNTLFVSHYTTPERLNITLGFIHAPNLENLRLTDLDAVLGGFEMDFAPTFEFLGTGTFSSFERLEVLELRRVSCYSGAAWDLFCAKLTNLRDINLGYMPVVPRGYDDGFPGYLNSLVLPIGDDVTEGGELRCPNLRSLSVSGWSEDTVIGIVQKRLSAGYGIPQVMYGAE